MKDFESKIIDRTNKFYLEISRKVLSPREYEVLHKLLIDKIPQHQVARDYEVTSERIRQIYESAFKKVKKVSGILEDIELYKQRLDALKESVLPRASSGSGKVKAAAMPDLDQKLCECSFPLGKRMSSFFELLEVSTIRDLSKISLKDFSCFRGFKGELRKELIAFIEFLHIESLWEGFEQWKNE